MAPKDMPLHGVWAKPKKSVGEASVKAKVFGKSGKDEDGKGKYGDGFCKGKDGMPKKGGGEASVKGKGFGKDKDGKGKYGKGFCEGQHGKGGKGKGNTAKAKETMEQYNARHKALDEKRAAVLWSQASEASEERSLPKATLGPSVIDEGKGEDSELAKADAKATPTTSRKIAPWKSSLSTCKRYQCIRDARYTWVPSVTRIPAIASSTHPTALHITPPSHPFHPIPPHPNPCHES